MLKQLFLILVSLSIFAETYTVETMNSKDGHSMVFNPSFLKIMPGDTVKFVPSSKGHTSHSVFTPKNARPWLIENNKTGEVTFKEEGVYIYDCKNHYVMGMNGVIQVGKALNLEEAKKFSKTYLKKVAMKKNRLNKSLNMVK